MRIEGHLNLGSAEQLEQQAKQAYANGTRYLLVDFAQVTSLTSAGMRALLAIAKMLGTGPVRDAKSPYLKFLNPPPQILNVLRMAGFTAFIEIFTDEQQAIASFEPVSAA